MPNPEECQHRVIRKKRSDDLHEYAFDAYVCGSCAQIFEVKPHEETPEPPKGPMFDRRPPWGLRNRQA